MSVNVRVPSQLRRFTSGSAEVTANGHTVGQVLDDLEKRFPGVQETLRDEQGEVRVIVNVYVNGDDIRFLSNVDTAVQDGDEVSILPAIAGGCVDLRT